ncbi:ATP-dependent bile acid permease [Flammula alnicola]|nr:ATP-dependent bile acid permease [Flammula alnicola]
MKLPWYNIFYPPPAPPGFGAGKVLPEQDAPWLSRLTFHWLTAFLDVGFSRPLEKEVNFWELPASRHTVTITDTVERNYYSRCPPEKRPLFMRDTVSDDYKPPTMTATAMQDREEKEETKSTADSPQKPSPYDESLFKALCLAFKPRIWGSGILLLASDTLKTTTPLLNKVLITWLTESYVYFHLSETERAIAAAEGFSKPRGIGYGIGLSVALFVMQAGMTTGLYVRTSVIGNIFRKSLRLSGRARAEHSVGQITTLISTDATRLDALSFLGHFLWDSPIQLAIAIGLLIGNIGYSALVGVAVLIVGLPIQFEKCVKITDRRVRLTTEVLQGIRLIKAYGWEAFYAQQITRLREQEVKRIRKSSFALALLIATFYFLPVFASVLSFITYSLTGHDLNIAIIFTSLQLFNILRAPLIFLPFVLSGLADATVSFGRLGKFLTAEELAEPYRIDPTQKSALHVEGDFEWETVVKLEDTSEKPGEVDEIEKLRKELEQKKAEKKAEKQRQKEASRKEGQSKWWNRNKKSEGGDKELLPSTTADAEKEKPEATEEEKPFSLKTCASTSQVVFGGPVAYVPQAPWIKNATVRENILFGQKNDNERFHEVIHACSLEHDLSILPHGENTEIGEKGINLSGQGQKARISLARAAYSNSDIVLLDDPLSAVDAHVGKRILEECLLRGPLASRTRILVTHALHVLDRTDYIYVMDNGKVIEEGSYHDLMAGSAIFSRLIEEYGSSESKMQNDATMGALTQRQAGMKVTDPAEAALMQEEERNTGAVTWDIYKKYLDNAGGLIWAPIIGALLLIVEGNNVVTTLFLGFWTGNTLHQFKQGDYMAVYAALGAALAVSTFILTYAFVIAGLIASLNLYKGALAGVLYSRISFFDTTPMGRILSRLSKDQDTIDTALPHSLMQFLTTFFSVGGTVALVFYTFPYLGIIFLPLAILYYGASVYYRRSSVETKRMDSLLRSMLYGSYSETLTGLSTIRAYGAQKRSVTSAEQGLDMENRAYLMTVIMQRWLAVRLEFFANVLVLGIALFGAGFRSTINPSKTSVVLTYTLSAEMISLFAQSEQSMNAVERVLHYVELPPEGSDSVTTDPPKTWPAEGAIVFRDVKMAYREGLPLVLKGVSFQIKRIGIVGRTGSGKSSLIQALLRLIDDHDISTIGFNALRTRLAFVPQDTTLFLGTLRDNLDPERLRTDSELISILQHAWLLPKEGPLDSVVGDEGSNYSAGEKQLLALCRALVKNSRIIILDEATSSVDAETDSKIQQTIQTEFATATLLCIAHRLNTIVHYDRVIVMDDGKVAEFDTVLNLIDRNDSIFRSLCDEAHLLRADILKLRREHGAN